jgi:nucleoid-associated protein EbfC
VEPQMDMQQLFAAAQQMQEQLMNAQQALADSEVTGTAGGSLVKATVNGQGELLDLSIQSAAVDTDDVEETARTIADLVLAAVRDAYRAAEDLQQQQMGPFAAAMQGGGMPGMPGGGGLDLPGGLDLSSLGLGGPGPQTPQSPQAPHRQDPDDEDKPET